MVVLKVVSCVSGFIVRSVFYGASVLWWLSCGYYHVVGVVLGVVSSGGCAGGSIL